ncbi:FAD-binding oxidoreductase [Actinomadura alba]|uniref:Delta(24)-sterol reductase n=1 Tax=Actinomadura alba TaxID=406431 RepID=A0ABR7LU89_9ACTN|nr:FAD-binding oxidoreductase [Actinomadura alba]
MRVPADSAVSAARTGDAWSRHAQAVEALQESYRAIPRDAPVRLAKRTSYLFRKRQAAGAPGLDVSRLGRVIDVDPDARTADVQAMTTYEDLVAATLAHRLMPAVVPQLKGITLGGAITGLGIESSSFRNGMPHESVLELEILTGDGRLITARPGEETDESSGERPRPDAGHADHSALFRGFPNSYGTLGYATRLKIRLEPVRPYVQLRHLRFARADRCAEAIAQICSSRSYEGTSVDFVDGTVFAPDEMYLTVGTFVDDAPFTSDYTRRKIYYRSLRERSADYLTVHDYLWRWDTDWFWSSRDLGLENPLVRALWPRSKLRSDVYRRLIAWDERTALSARLDRWTRRPPREDVIQNVEIPLDRIGEYLEFFHREIGISPVWLCPLRALRRWPLYPLDPNQIYIDVGFWSRVQLRAGQSPDHHNRLIEDEIARLGGCKALYSTSYYTEDEFWRRYNGPAYRPLKDAYDPDGRLHDLYEKCVVGR